MYNRESRIMRKLLGKTVTNDAAAAAAAATSGESTTRGSSTPTGPITTSYRPTKPQNAVHAVAAPISCLDVTVDGRAAILGGPHILRTLVLDQTEGPGLFRFSEGIDVRASITSQKASGAGTVGGGGGANVVADQLNIRDVKWHDNGTVFTACASGRIFAYDLSRSGGAGAPTEPVNYIQMQEDGRQVNTLDVNPHLRSWLLSGGQDGIARIFDVSAPVATRSGALTFRQRFSPLRSNEAIRQVAWSPRVGHEMACCTEGGVVLKWDVRQPQRPLLRISAHDKPCVAVAWHPDGVHLVSAGRDAKLHVWDLGASADKRQKPRWTIATPAPVASLAWRPGMWSAAARTRRAAQIAVSYDESGGGSSRRCGAPVVHVWDLARPTVPYKEVERFGGSPAAIAWRDRDLLWTVGQDGLFAQCDIACAARAVDRLSTSTIAFSPRGEAVAFLDERPRPNRPRLVPQQQQQQQRGETTPQPSSQLSGSRSDSEEDSLRTFIGAHRGSAHRRRLSGRTGQVLNTTTTPTTTTTSYATQSGEEGDLDQSIGVTGMFRLQQVMATGKLPAATNVPVYQYLTASYLEILERMLPKSDDETTLAQRVGNILDRFALVSENVRLYRLSQTWRIVAFAMDLLLKRRASHHLEMRFSRFQKIQVDGSSSGGKPVILPKQPGIHRAGYRGEETPRRSSTQASSLDGRPHALRSLLSEEIESTSNVPTPVARPVDTAKAQEWEKNGGGGGYQHGGKMLTPILEPESFDIGPPASGGYGNGFTTAAAAYSQGSSQTVSDTSRESNLSESSTTGGYDFYDAETLARAIDVPLPKANEAANGNRHGSRAQAQLGSESERDLQDEDSISEVFSISDRAESRSLRSSSAVEIAGTAKSRSESGSGSGSKLSSGQGSADTEYEPRIHGDTERRKPKTTTATAGAHGAPDDLFMMSQTTASTDDAYASQTSFASQFDSDQTASFQQQQEQPQQPAEPAETAMRRAESVGNTPLRHDSDTRPHVIETDYYHWPGDPDFLSTNGGSGGEPAVPAALDAHLVLQRAFEFECRTSMANAAAMVLLLRPLLPDGIMDSHLARGVLRQHHKRLTGMGLLVEASSLRKLCVRGWPAGMPDWGENYAAIFGPAQQGIKTGLRCSACGRPREVDPALGRDAIWTCERCRAVMGPCAVCRHRDAEMPAHIPGSRGEEGEGEDKDGWVSNWWWYCPGCAHGGHASCLQIWHDAVEEETAEEDRDRRSSDYMNSANNTNGRGKKITFSGGCCPLDGCGHACLPGRYREEMATARSDELGRTVLESVRARGGDDVRGVVGVGVGGYGSGSSRRTSPSGRDRDRGGGGGGVRSDGNDSIPQSRAVGMAREALNRSAGAGAASPGSGSAPGSGGGILSSSPGRAIVSAMMGTGMGERRKSVKFVKTDR